MRDFENFEKIFLYAALALTTAALIFSFYTIIQPINKSQTIKAASSITGRMGFTSFDAELAKEFMDKNNDGMCDFCGMRIEDCIASGMMECSMDPDAKIGLLGSAHIHADLKVYINNNAVNFANPEYYMKSMMMHLDDNQNPEDAGGVMHMHATGIPLWLFFKSIDKELSKDANLYVNGKYNNEGLNYVFKDNDGLLITDSKSEDVIQKQILSIGDYAKGH